MPSTSALTTNPANILFSTNTPQITNCCDHYVGKIEFLHKAIKLRRDKSLCFDITCDLEDGAQVGEEKALLSSFIETLASVYPKEENVGVRIHDYSSKFWRSEVASIIRSIGSRISHITIPKIRSARELMAMLKHIEKCAKQSRIRRSIPIHVLVETLSAFEEISRIAALPGLRCLEFGLMDFVSEHAGVIPASCMSSPGQFEHQLIIQAKTKIVSAACRHGLSAAHNVTTAFSDVQQTFNDALIARARFGFTRMWSIHPSQIEPIIRAMRPSDDEISLAEKVITLAAKSNWGPIKVDNTLHDRASFRYFWMLLQRARSSGQRLTTGVESLLQQSARK